MTASGDSIHDAAERFRQRFETLSDDPLPPDRADAAVVILVRTGTGGLEVLAEQRAERPGDPWSGQVGLPGGRKDPKDRSLRETALRELREEVGLLPSALDGSPRNFDVRRARPSGLRVAVFAGLSAAVPRPAGRVDPEEVSATFWLPLQVLGQVETRPRPTMFGDLYVDTVAYEGHIVWGFTLRLLRDFVAWLGATEGSVPATPTELRRSRSQAL